jgi:hypothetical protein
MRIVGTRKDRYTEIHTNRPKRKKKEGDSNRKTLKDNEMKKGSEILQEMSIER